MQCFGLFELGPVIASGGGTITYEARKQTDPAGRYVVKVFDPEQLVPKEASEAKAELTPLLQEFGAEFAGRVQVQKEAAEGSSCFVPILGAGYEDRGTWYATRYYPRSVQGLLEGGIALEAPDIFHILDGLVQAALHLKRTGGRSHGNLKPANIFLEGLRKVRRCRVLVADALAGDYEDERRFERADLRAIGQLLYQLVLRRKMDFAQVEVPIEPGTEWSTVFGKQASQWVALCNRLLAPDPSTARISLEILERDLKLLEPRPPLPLAALAISSVMLVLIGLTGFAVLHHRRADTSTESNDSVTSSGPDQADASTALLNAHPDSGVVTFDLGPADVRGQATIERENKKFPAGETFSQPPGETVFYRFEAPGYEPCTTNIILGPKETRRVSINLLRQVVPVKLVSRPPGIPFFTLDNAPVKRTGEFYLLPWGSVQIVARHPRLGARTNSLMLFLDRPNTGPLFQFSFGTLILTNLAEDVTVAEENTPVGTPADKMVYEPLGPHMYVLHNKSGFETIVTNIIEGENYLLPTSAGK